MRQARDMHGSEAMSNAEIFILPGSIAAKFALSLLGVNAMAVEPQAMWLFSMALTLCIWAWTFKVLIAVLKKAFGFEGKAR